MLVKLDPRSFPKSLFDPRWRPSPRSDLGSDLAAARSDGQGRPQAVAKQLVLDGHEHGGGLPLVGRSFPAARANDDNSEGGSPSWTQIAP